MSANYLVDLGSTTPTFQLTGGAFYPASGTTVSNIVDLLHFNSFTNICVIGSSQYASGSFSLHVQTSDDTTSGNFTDPLSGFAVMPTVFTSGATITFNSGGRGGTGVGGVFGEFTSGQSIESGFIAFAGFQRDKRFLRIRIPAAGPMQFNGGIAAVCQGKTTGSGGGYTTSPSSGAVNV